MTKLLQAPWQIAFCIFPVNARYPENSVKFQVFIHNSPRKCQLEKQKKKIKKRYHADPARFSLTVLSWDISSWKGAAFVFKPPILSGTRKCAGRQTLPASRGKEVPSSLMAEQKKTKRTPEVLVKVQAWTLVACEKGLFIFTQKLLGLGLEVKISFFLLQHAPEPPRVVAAKPYCGQCETTHFFQVLLEKHLIMTRTKWNIPSYLYQINPGFYKTVVSDRAWVFALYRLHGYPSTALRHVPGSVECRQIPEICNRLLLILPTANKLQVWKSICTHIKS